MEVPLPADEHAPLRAQTLRAAGLSTTIQLSAPDAALRLLMACRVASIDAREAYFAPSQGFASKVTMAPVPGGRESIALSPRNETAACALMLELLQAAGPKAGAVLSSARALCDAALSAPRADAALSPPRADDGEEPRVVAAAAAAPPDDGGVGEAMVAWLKSGTHEGGSGGHVSGHVSGHVNGGTPAPPPHVAVAPARFPSTGRGAAATVDIVPGDDALTVPRAALWTVADAVDAPGPRGDAYRTFAALGEDTLAVLWLVAERALGAASPWAPLLAALPLDGSAPGVGTPLGWPLDVTQALLAGTPLLADACAARDKLGRQYHALFPALSDNMPEVFPASVYTAENFRAATEAWNAYGMTVQGEAAGGTEAPGAPVTCLPPVALLCNHTLWPHVVRYSRLRGGALHLPVARRVRAGEEVFVSYGAKSNAELLLFYGFAVENNPYDDVPMSLELPAGEVAEVTAARSAALARAGLTLTPHAVRAGPLPLPLVGALRVLTADPAALGTFTADPRIAPVSSEGEAAAAAALCGALAAMLEQFEEGEAAAAAAAADVAGALQRGAAVGTLKAGGIRAALVYRAGVRRTLEAAMGEARKWRAAVGGAPDPALGKRSRD